jgi:hypothetical protein
MNFDRLRFSTLRESMKNFFLSLKTAVWTLLALVVAFFAGSFVMPLHREIFGPMNELLLVDWLREVAIRSFGQTWWFFISLALLVLLTINTLVCSLQAIQGRWSRSDALLRIAPQIMHIGFLCILLAHLLGAGWGYRLSGAVPEGAFVHIPGDRILHLRELRVLPGSGGMMRGDWQADITLYRGDRKIAEGILGPNRPLFNEGAGIYLKSFEFDPSPVAFLLVNRDPGAIWALTGGIVFIAGSALLLAARWKHA